jgi:hypothetical protein
MLLWRVVEDSEASEVWYNVALEAIEEEGVFES